MDSLLVDLDKVLDDLEAEENDVLPPGHEKQPSGYEEYLEQHSEKPWKVLSEVPYQQGDKSQFSGSVILPGDKNRVNIMYDIPYEPTEKFDLSEADFAPSPTAGKKDFTGTNIYDFNKEAETSSHFNSDYEKLGLNRPLQNEFCLPKTDPASNSNFSKNDLQNATFKLPVQPAELSPDKDNAVQLNGHATDSELFSPKQSSISERKEEPVIQPLTLSSLSSSTSDRTGSDTDKVPVQCNTPSTPYENVFLNPFDSQMKLVKISDIPDPNQSLEVQPSGSEFSSHSDINTANHSDIRSQVLAQNPSLSLSDSHNGSYSSLPPSNGQPNPACQFHSLPTTLGFQTSVKELNQNGHQDNNREPPASEQYQPPVENVDKVIMEPHKAVLDQGDKHDTHTQKSEICSFNDDVELSEDDLDSYLENEDTDITVEPNVTTDRAVETEIMSHETDFDLVQETTNVKPTVILNDNTVNINKYHDVKNEMTDDTSETVSNICSSESESVPAVTLINSSGRDISRVKQMQIHSDGQTVETCKPLTVNSHQAKEETENKVGYKMNSVGTDGSENSSSCNELNSVANSVGGPQAAVIPSKDEALETVTVTFDNGATDNGDSYVPSGTIADLIDIDIKPLDSQEKSQRPNSLQGLSVADTNSSSPFVGVSNQNVSDSHESLHSHKEREIVSKEHENAERENEGRQLLDIDQTQTPEGTNVVSSSNTSEDVNVSGEPDGEDATVDEEIVELRQTQLQTGDNGSSVRPQSWGPSDTGQPQVLKQKRPTSLNLSPRPEFSTQNDRSPVDQSPEETGASGENISENLPYTGEEMSGAVAGAEGPSLRAEHPPYDPGPPPPYSSTLGRVAPKWVPDAEAPACMNCDAKFTFTKRRHHCRACGKVFCSQCCSMKNRLAHMENREGRVCFQCHQLIAQAEHWNEASCAGRTPHPNNPNDYCSTVPPTQQAASSLSPPSVLVPVAGVLKRDGGNRRSAEPKQVMFSDGIRPGGDLTELDGSAEVTRMPPRRSRVQKKVERHSQDGHHSPRSRRVRTVEDRTSRCLIPEDGLPPLMLSTEPGSGYSLMPNPQPEDFMQQVKDEEASPVIFAITPNLNVQVKIINLDCCVNHVVWCFTTQGMCSVGQEEIVTALEVSPDEATVPRDIFTHLYTVYEEASKGNVVTELGHTIFNQSFLGSRDHGGFLYVRASFQCVQKFILPQPPYLFGILLQKWETPWAKVFPIRLMLRLGAEYRYYPCPLMGVRNRKPVYFEIGHTIMNLLADFRNYQYMLPQISGITVHMEDKVTWINFPKNRYDELMKVVNNSNEHVMAIGASFSMEADSHLVCIQNDDGNYQTQAINIQNKPRKVTGASFVVFNGALKTSSGMSAKSSIVEDGLMVQITPDSMLALKQAMKDMQNYTISCGTINAPKPDEMVKVQWVEDDKSVNVGVKSPVDNMAMDGIDSLHIYNSPDYVGETQIVRWTEVFFIQNDDSGSVKWDPVDLSRLGETLATACCMALVPHLSKLKEAALTKIGLRVTIKPEMVGYEAGSGGERLPDIYMNDLDNELIPVMHRATQQNHVGTVLELIFQILN